VRLAENEERAATAAGRMAVIMLALAALMHYFPDVWNMEICWEIPPIGIEMRS
jgi:hypothetical protein